MPMYRKEIALKTFAPWQSAVDKLVGRQAKSQKVQCSLAQLFSLH